MESIKNATVVKIAEETQIAAARRAAGDLCRRMELTDAATGRAELITVELAANLLHHAGEGTIFLGPTAVGRGLQILATDCGPGLGDVERAMEDGFTTGTTPGVGLGAVRRVADSIDIYSRLREGTIVAAEVRDQPEPGASATAVLSTHIEGEMVNGDSWAIHPGPERTVYVAIDGLGHGQNAAIAAATALRVAEAALAQDERAELAAIMQRMHVPMQATRGAAVMLISVSRDNAKVRCCGIGNLSAVLCFADGTTRPLVSHNGTVGHRMARVQEFEYTASPGALLIVHSDGVSTRWKLTQYPGLFRHSPAVIAGALYRESARGRDDATVLVSRLQSTGGDLHG